MRRLANLGSQVTARLAQSVERKALNLVVVGSRHGVGDTGTAIVVVQSCGRDLEWYDGND